MNESPYTGVRICLGEKETTKKSIEKPGLPEVSDIDWGLKHLLTLWGRGEGLKENGDKRTHIISGLDGISNVIKSNHSSAT